MNLTLQKIFEENDQQTVADHLEDSEDSLHTIDVWNRIAKKFL